MNIVEIPEELMSGEKNLPYKIIPGTFIAGSAIRSWFTGTETPNDVDFFGFDYGHMKSLEIANDFKTVLYNNKFATTYDVNGKMVQLVKLYYTNIQELFENFDYTVCQFAWDGSNIYSTTRALIDTLEKKLIVNKIRPEAPVSGLKRAFKYYKKGFVPTLETLAEIGKAFMSQSEEVINGDLKELNYSDVDRNCDVGLSVKTEMSTEEILKVCAQEKKLREMGIGNCIQGIEL